MKESAPQLWYVYIVECSDGTFYTGYTNDVDKRVSTHNKGRGAKYTRTRRPVTLVYCVSYPTKSLAMSGEYYVKQMSRQSKLFMIAVYKNRDKIAELE